MPADGIQHVWFYCWNDQISIKFVSWDVNLDKEHIFIQTGSSFIISGIVYLTISILHHSDMKKTVGLHNFSEQNALIIAFQNLSWWLDDGVCRLTSINRCKTVSLILFIKKTWTSESDILSRLHVYLLIDAKLTILSFFYFKNC